MADEKPKKETAKPTEAALNKRAAARGYTIEKDDDGQWYAEIAGTRYGPMQTLDEVDEFLPAE
jgi:hypothetical protein